MAKQYVWNDVLQKFELVECDDLLELMEEMIAEMAVPQDSPPAPTEF